MKFNKILAILLCVCMLLSLTACGKKQYTQHSNTEVLNMEDDYPIVKEEYQDQVVLKMMASCSATIDSDWSKNKFFKRMNDVTGVNFDFENVFLEDMYKQKKGLVFTSEDSMPDVFFKAFFNNFDEVTYGSSKQIIPLNSLIKNYAPNIQKILDENPIIKRCITTTDGNIYALPTMYLNTPNDSIMRAFWWINKNWLIDANKANGVGNNGLDEDGQPVLPQTIEELYDVLVYFRDYKCSGEFSSPLVICGLSELLNLFPIFGLDLSQYYVQADANGELQFNPQSENFKVALKWLNKFFKEGLINEDWNTFTETKKYSYGAQGGGETFGMYQSASPSYVSGSNKVEQFITVDPMVCTELGNTNPFWSASYPLERGCFAITSVCEYPEVAIRWIDTLYDTTKPYGKWAIIGKENTEWQWTDSVKTEWRSLVSDAEYADRMGDTIVQPGDGMPYAVDETFFDKEVTNSAKYVRQYRNRQMTFGKVSFPMVYFSKSELRSLSGLSSDIDTYVRRFIASSINEGINDAKFNDFKAFSNMGLEEYMQILQKAYDNFYGL